MQNRIHKICVISFLMFLLSSCGTVDKHVFSLYNSIGYVSDSYLMIDNCLHSYVYVRQVHVQKINEYYLGEFEEKGDTLFLLVDIIYDNVDTMKIDCPFNMTSDVDFCANKFVFLREKSGLKNITEEYWHPTNSKSKNEAELFLKKQKIGLNKKDKKVIRYFDSPKNYFRNLEKVSEQLNKN